VRLRGSRALGTKVEIKNLNSFAHVKKAIEHEIERQVAALEAGKALVQETRLFEPASGATKTMRSKEEAMDYRYFPDPDLGALVVDEAWEREVAAAMPELPEARAARFTSAFGLPAADADLVCLSRPLADYYEAAVAAHPKNPKALANWLLSELLAKMSDADRHAGRLPVDDLVKEKGLVQISDEGPIRDAVAKVLADNPAQVATYRGGKAAAFGWFVGQVMKALAGRGNPGVVNRLLRDALEKDYQVRRVLRDVTFKTKKGEFLFLTGPSGAGKSTLLKLIFQAEKPTEGQIIVNGMNVSGMPASRVPALRRSMGIVFQDYKLLPARTVLDNVTYVQKFLGVPAAERRRRAYQTLRLVELHHRMSALPEELSGGEQQRVALARALVNEPALLIADEPTGNLDHRLAGEVMKLLQDISVRGTTVLVATHDQDLVRAAGRRCLTLDRGRVVEGL